MTERELLAVVSAIVFEGSNDNAVDAVRRGGAILRRVDEVLNETLAAPPGTQPLVTSEPLVETFNRTPAVVEHEEQTHAKGKRAK